MNHYARNVALARPLPLILGRVRTFAIVIGILFSQATLGQTTRTTPSALPTIGTLPASSSTSPNTPCSSFNSTSPCYSGGTSRRPCYSAVAPDQPCPTAALPYSQTSPTPSPPVSKTSQSAGAVHAFTQDQATATIEAQGYSSVSDLRRDSKGVWHARAEKDGQFRNVILDAKGTVADN